MAGLDLPARAIREQIASAVHLIVQQSRLQDGSRRITYVTEICGQEGDAVRDPRRLPLRADRPDARRQGAWGSSGRPGTCRRSSRTCRTSASRCRRKSSSTRRYDRDDAAAEARRAGRAVRGRRAVRERRRRGRRRLVAPADAHVRLVDRRRVRRDVRGDHHRARAGVHHRHDGRWRASSASCSATRWPAASSSRSSSAASATSFRACSCCGAGGRAWTASTTSSSTRCG